MAVKQFKNNRRKMIKERTEKGSLPKMLDTFNNKIYDLENGDFDESIDNKNRPNWMDDDVGFDIPEPDEKTVYDICDDEDEDFEESFNIDEMAKPHTWGVTYRDKYNKIKQHIIDAPDAYDAKMKARRELGINFSSIVDAEMIEDVDRLDEGLTGTAKKLFDNAEDDIVGLIMTKLLKAAGKLTEDEFKDFVKALKSSATEAFDTAEYSELVDALDSAKD